MKHLILLVLLTVIVFLIIATTFETGSQTQRQVLDMTKSLDSVLHVLTMTFECKVACNIRLYCQ